MGRKKGSTNKKAVEEVVSAIVETPKVEEIKQLKIGRVSMDFGREDLNQLKDKVNEIINFIDPLN